jgi:hypothetical protein
MRFSSTATSSVCATPPKTTPLRGVTSTYSRPQTHSEYTAGGQRQDRLAAASRCLGEARGASRWHGGCVRSGQRGCRGSWNGTCVSSSPAAPWRGALHASGAAAARERYSLPSSKGRICALARRPRHACERPATPARSRFRALDSQRRPAVRGLAWGREQERPTRAMPR